MIISPNLKCYNTLEYVRQSKANILCQRVEYFIQAILKSADIRAIVKGVEVDYSVIIKVYIRLNDVFEKCTMIMI